MFSEELIDAFPEAKVILTVRDEDAWYKSMTSTIWHAYSSPTANKNAPLRPLAEKYHQHLWQNDFEKYGRQSFRDHNELLRRLGKEMGESRFLEYSIGEGWERLCAFLGVEVPVGVEYPRADDWASYKEANAGKKQA